MPEIGASAAGPRSPESESSTAGTPRAPNGPCSVSVSGKARCANWPNRLVPRDAIPACWCSAAATVLRSCVGATCCPWDQGTITGWRR